MATLRFRGINLTSSTLLALAACPLVAGCAGSSKGRSTRLETDVSAIAVKCHESDSEAKSELSAARQVLARRKLAVSQARLASDFEKDTTYALKANKTVNCTNVLALLLLSFEKSA